MGVVLLGILRDLAFEVRYRLEGVATDRLMSDQSEPTLDLVEPARVGRREVRVIARTPSEPRFDLRVLVSA